VLLEAEGEDGSMEEAKGSKQSKREERVKGWQEVAEEEQLPGYRLKVALKLCGRETEKRREEKSTKKCSGGQRESAIGAREINQVVEVGPAGDNSNLAEKKADEGEAGLGEGNC